MGTIARDKREIRLYYHSGTSLGKQTYAYVKASEREIRAIDLAKTHIPGTQWAELASGLDKKIADLVNTEHPSFVEAYGSQNPSLDEHDWLRVLEKHPETLAHPIIVMGSNTHSINSPSDFLEYMKIDSRGQSKT
ncbi:arsenate reductase family protein [Ulvibacterium sp.]|uniref:arsenate reductase family protein n=1 Tax=Ulvibacterium sp. TaxID=2665914 RepID=UPI003BACB6DD